MPRDPRLAPAMFCGASFYVDQQSLEDGRRIARHEYVDSDQYDLEDLGSSVTSLELTCYFIGDTFDADVMAFRAAIKIKGASQLIVPVYGALSARVETSSIRWGGANALNRVDCTLKFLIDPTPAGAIAIPSGLGQRAMVDALAGLPAVLASAIFAAFSIELSSYDVSDAANAVLDAVSIVTTVQQSVSLADSDGSAATAVLGAIVDTVSADDALGISGAAGQTFTALDGIIDAARNLTNTTQLQAALDMALADYATQVALDPNGNAPMIPAANAVMIGAEIIRVVVGVDYTNRTDAIAARTQIATTADEVGTVYECLGPDATGAFDTIVGDGVTYLSDQIINLAPISVYQTNASLCSSVLAYRLYGDPDRGTELVDRNRATMPCFMPLKFEASAT